MRRGLRLPTLSLFIPYRHTDSVRPPSDRGVSPVIAVILLVAITVVLAAVLYVTVSNLTPGGQDLHGPVFFTLDTSGTNSTTTTWRVSGTDSNPRELTNYKTALFVDGVRQNSSAFDPVEVGTHGNVTFRSIDARLTTGDTFAFQHGAGSLYLFVIFIRGSGNELGRVQWNP